MTRVLLWKEFREHQQVWVAMTALALGVVLGLPWALSAEGYSNLYRDDFRVVQIALLAVVGVYGLVCGGMMLAGEREGGTLPFLDGLAGRRRGIWGVKMLAGLGLALFVGLVTGGSATAVGLGSHEWKAIHWIVALPLVGVYGFMFGLLGSSFTRSALAGASVGAFLGLWPGSLAALALSDRNPETKSFAMGVIVQVVFAAAAGLLSLVRFTRQDLSRAPARTWLGRKARDSHGSFRTLLWLTYRQVRWEMLVLGVIACVLGLFLPSNLFGVWAALTALLGVVCGTGVFSGEQRGEYQRFLGDQRLPAGRIWWIKILLALIGLMYLVILLAGIGLFAFVQNSSPSPWHPGVGLTADLFRITGFFTLAFIWLAHGFAAGQFFTMISRKSVIAVVFAAIFCGVQLVFWLPSLLTGGLAWWLAFMPPLLLLLATRLAAWGWSTGAMNSPRVVLTLIACLAGAVFWQAAALGYRAIEIPAAKPPVDLEEYLTSLPRGERYREGEQIKQLGNDMASWDETVTKEYAGTDLFRGDNEEIVPPGIAPTQSWNVAVRLLERPAGWPRDRDMLARWLDRMFAGEWAAGLKDTLDRPPAMLQHPGLAGQWSVVQSRTMYGVQSAGYFLLARALQLQDKGDYAAALEQIELALALSRHQRNHAVGVAAHMGQAIERFAVQALDRWITAVGGNRELLHRAIEVLERHQKERPPLTNLLRAEYVFLQRQIAPEAEIPFWLSPQQPNDPGLKPLAGLIVLSLQTPWEKERMQRLLDASLGGKIRAAEVGFAQAAEFAQGMQPVASDSHARFWLAEWIAPKGANVDAPALAHWLHHSWLLWRGLPGDDGRLTRETLVLSRLAAMRLKIALMEYQLDHPEPATRLEDLVPKYIAALPVSPLNRPPHQPIDSGFEYRVTAEAEVVNEENPERGARGRPVRKLQPGEAVLVGAPPSFRELPRGATSALHFIYQYCDATVADTEVPVYILPRLPRK